MAGIFFTYPDEIFKTDFEIDKISILLAKDDIAAKDKRDSQIFDDAFVSDI